MSSFLYIPSFQIGALASNAKANNKLGNIDARFWDKDFPDEFKYPYFLLTAGHSFKDLDTRKKHGLEDAFVIGDSGGFQIATGVLDWEDETKREITRKQIFNWLENNSDVAMNIDIPTRMKYEGQFDKCLELSYENFKYFAENQTGKTKFLNVIQGTDYHTYSKWYHKVKEFDFNGWAIGGGAASVFRFMCGLTLLVENKEHLKHNIEYLHLLGASSPTYFFLMTQLQKSFEEVGSITKVMVDSSTPNIMSKFGMYAVGYDLKKLNVINIHLPKKPEKDAENYIGYPLPTTCDYDKWLNENSDLGKMVDFENKQYIGFVQHNLYMYLQMKKEIEYYVNGPRYILEQITTKNMVDMLDVIDKIVKSDKPYEVLMKHMPLIEKVSKSTVYDEFEKPKTITESKFFKKQ